MSRTRFVFALCALSLGAPAAFAQSATPAVSTVVAFSISNPVGNLTLGSDGAIYGVSAPATNITSGLIYRAAVDGSDVTTLHQLAPQNDGLSPQAGLTLGSDGMLYGTTKFGRSSEALGTGTIFRVSPTGTGFTVLHRFEPYTGSNANQSPINEFGAYPEAELIEGADGFLYGTTSAGGPNGTGAVFKISKSGSDFVSLHTFGPDTDTSTTSGLVVTEDGAAPLGPLVQGADGMLYGTTSVGGDHGRGTIFRIAADGSDFVPLKQFSATTADATTGLLENADGAGPLAGLTDGHDGYFYGVTSVGGETGQGVLFSISAENGTYTVLHTFDGTTGQRPVGELLVGADGKLYGTTSSGGVNSSGSASSSGTIFSIEPAGNEPANTNFTRMHTFESSVGSAPSTKLVQIAGGDLIGTVTSGGKCGYGSMYRYSASGATVDGNTKCGRVKNNNSGGGAGGPALVLLLSTMVWLRRRIA